MFVASYRNTERGTSKLLAMKQAEKDQARRELIRAEAEHRQMEDKIRARIAAEHHNRVQEWEEARRERARSSGVRFHRSFQKIEASICRVFNFNRTELRSGSRNARLVLARHAVIYWASRLTLLSLPQIGRLMGDRDHTTILSAKNRYPAKRAKMGRTLRKAR